MAAPAYSRSLANLTKRLKLSPASIAQCPNRSLHQTSTRWQDLPAEPVPSQSPQSLDQTPPQVNVLANKQHTATAPSLPAVSSLSTEELEAELQRIRLPRAVQAAYLSPLRHPATKCDTVAQLQMRSYSVRNLEAFADFAMRAAYFLKLPALGPNPLPRITERWTVPRSNFIFKKSQENFERITLRRLITIQDGHPETVSLWLAFLQKHRYYGIGMKANVWERSGLDVAMDMDAEGERISKQLGEKLDLVGGWDSVVQNQDAMEKLLHEEPLKAAWGSRAPMAAAEGAPGANDRVPLVQVGSRQPRRRSKRAPADEEGKSGDQSLKKDDKSNESS